MEFRDSRKNEKRKKYKCVREVKEDHSVGRVPFKLLLNTSLGTTRKLRQDSTKRREMRRSLHFLQARYVGPLRWERAVKVIFSQRTTKEISGEASP